MAFGRTAEVMGQYLKKGRPVFVEGRIQTRSWDSEGQKKYRTEIVVDNFQCGPQAGGAAAGGARTADEPSQDTGSSDSIQYPDEEINPEDIPF